MKFLFFPATAGERVLKRLFWNFTLLLLGLTSNALAGSHRSWLLRGSLIAIAGGAIAFRVGSLLHFYGWDVGVALRSPERNVTALGTTAMTIFVASQIAKNDFVSSTLGLMAAFVNLILVRLEVKRNEAEKLQPWSSRRLEVLDGAIVTSSGLWIVAEVLLLLEDGLLHDIAIASSATGLAFFLVAALYFATANAIPGRTPNLPLVAIPPPQETI